ncbi:hypothetical protein FGO68_gene6407 [Halteria grandinella]|uniref:Ankyrin repeat domain-containing protein n=1 Tax=Halteria grandinella TaxID=5974 RepID=A0A8J8P8J2_HALGN|nr:hypothetical protein FGO68_gene6407 [Halteria grandinella]
MSSQSSGRGGEEYNIDFEFDSNDDKINRAKIQNQDDQMKAEMDFFEQRKTMLRTISQDRVRKCWNAVMLSFFFLTSFFAFFIYTYFYHAQSLETLNLIQMQSPAFFKRFEHISLQYQFIREKIVVGDLNDTLLDFRLPANPIMTKTSDGNKIPIGMYYHEVSMKGETEIQLLKTQNPSYLGPLIEFVNLLDTDKFCETVFNINALQISDEDQSFKISSSQLQALLSESYQVEINNDIPIILAIQKDDLSKLQQLKAEGKIFGQPDYDKRYPLHIAAHRGNLQIVSFLITTGIDLSPVDRWGVTPLSEAADFPEVYQLLKAAGAKLGAPRENFVSRKVVLTDNQYRLFFAAHYNDITMMKALKQLGWDVNIQDRTGRTPLQIAASQGNLEALVHLLASGANLKNIDARGNDALDDAIREKQPAIVNLLVEKALVKDQCKSFENNLFSKGFSSTLGVFNRKFSDVQITLDDTPNKKLLLTLLGAKVSTNTNDNTNSNKTTNNSTNSTIKNSISSTYTDSQLASSSDTTQRVIQVFFSSQELYIRQVINRQEQILQETYKLYSEDYKNVAEIVFFLFLIIQLLTLFVLRSRFIENLKEEVMHSRGILNLVPERFFRENQNEVEKVIKMITQ